MEALKKRTYPSAAQKTRLIALLEADEELRMGKFSASFTKKDGERRWAIIAQDLNSIPGAKREWKDWRKTWQDMKAAAKKKSAACRFSSTSTGGGPPAPPLSEENLAILSTLSSSAVFGHEDCYESTVKFENIPNTYMSAEKVVGLINEDHSSPPPAKPPAAAKAIIKMLHEDLPGTSSMPTVWKEIRNDQVPETTANEDKTGSNATNADKENRSTTRPTKIIKRRAAVRRLDHSLAVAESVEKLMKEKLELKKFFYESVITEMREQTKMLKNISEKLGF